MRGFVFFSVSAMRRTVSRLHTTAPGAAKKLRKSLLSAVPGIGPAKERLLLRRFGSVKNIRASTIDNLTQICGINESLAQNILDTLRENVVGED